jgi:uncharacterized membrane protein YkoI
MKKLAIIATLIISTIFISVPSSYAAGVSQQKAASIAQGEYPGRVIDAKLIKHNGELAYRVKILDREGGIHIVIVSQATGAVLSSH